MLIPRHPAERGLPKKLPHSAAGWEVVFSTEGETCFVAGARTWRDAKLGKPEPLSGAGLLIDATPFLLSAPGGAVSNTLRAGCLLAAWFLALWTPAGY